MMKFDNGYMVFDPHEMIMITALMLQPVVSTEETNEAIASMEVWANAVAGRAVNGRDKYYTIYQTKGYLLLRRCYGLTFSLPYGLRCSIHPRYLYNHTIYLNLTAQAAARSLTALVRPNANKVKQSQYCAALGSMLLQQKVNRAQSAKHLRSQSWLNL